MRLILASSSPIRRAMLDTAGVDFEAIAPRVDETGLKAKLEGPVAIALGLAEAKALSVSQTHAGDWVIGSDSVVAVDERTFDKPASREQAAEHLRFFSGKAMALTSAVALARAGSVEWSHAETAALRMRSLSNLFIERYLEQEWPEVGYCVGVFRMEGRGVQLFDSIAGDHFTILGMPLIALLGALRDRGLLPA